MSTMHHSARFDNIRSATLERVSRWSKLTAKRRFASVKKRRISSRRFRSLMSNAATAAPRISPKRLCTGVMLSET